MAKVLVIDDDLATCEALMELVRNIGHEAVCATDLAQGLGAALDEEFDVIFLDVRLPDGNGLTILPRLKDLPEPPEVIILTGLGDPDGAELAIRSGAWDYLQKPLSPKKILLPRQRVLKYRDNLRTHCAPAHDFKRCGIVGQSPAIRRTMERLAAAARSDASVLITGETGTGKELFAHALHENSRRAGKAFVVVDCAAIPGSLLESTLFGHVKGAFTGAEQAGEGLVLEADGGTLFLDEIGEMPLDLQKKLLRVLQERKYRPVGGGAEVASDFRLVAATNRNLERMAGDGRFRPDLLYRLGAMTLELPPLRERKEDIEELARCMVQGLCRRNAIPAKTLAPDFLQALRSCDWPGNVRELANALESSVVAAFDAPELFAGHLPEGLRIRMLKQALAVAGRELPQDAPLAGAGQGVEALLAGPEAFSSYKDFRRDVLDVAEKRYFSRLMEVARWNIERACELSGLGKSRLYGQLRTHGIDKR